MIDHHTIKLALGGEAQRDHEKAKRRQNSSRWKISLNSSGSSKARNHWGLCGYGESQGCAEGALKTLICLPLQFSLVTRIVSAEIPPLFLSMSILNLPTNCSWRSFVKKNANPVVTALYSSGVLCFRNRPSKLIGAVRPGSIGLGVL
jgi:hypothetical protein